MNRPNKDRAKQLPNDLPQRLAKRLEERLPGASAQRVLAPQLAYGRHLGPAFSSARRAAVALLLYPKQQQWHLPLTLRPASMSHHASQLSLPGGALDPGETEPQCALRELQEELSVARQQVHPLLPLSTLYVFASNFLVAPWLLWAQQCPAFVPHAPEVAELVEFPVAALLEPHRYGRHVIRRGGLQFQSPHIQYDKHLVWGATAMILSELAAVLRLEVAAEGEAEQA